MVTTLSLQMTRHRSRQVLAIIHNDGVWKAGESHHEHCGTVRDTIKFVLCWGNALRESHHVKYLSKVRAHNTKSFHIWCNLMLPIKNSACTK